MNRKNFLYPIVSFVCLLTAAPVFADPVYTQPSVSLASYFVITAGTLILAFLLEAAFLIFFWRKNIKMVMIPVLIANVISTPLLTWLTFSLSAAGYRILTTTLNWIIFIVIAEILVIFLEYAIYYLLFKKPLARLIISPISKRKLLLGTILANLFSFIVGSLILNFVFLQ